jgi:hypothetical protein
VPRCARRQIASCIKSVGVLVSSSVVSATAQDPVAREIARLEQNFVDALRNARYMEQSCEPATYAGWEGLPLVRCRYALSGGDGLKKKRW